MEGWMNGWVDGRKDGWPDMGKDGWMLRWSYREIGALIFYC